MKSTIRKVVGSKRRDFLGRAAAVGFTGLGAGALGGLVGPFVRPARAQSLRKVTLTLSWLAQGNTAYSYVAQAVGAWEKRGLAVDIARGFGSTASAQAIAGGRFQFGLTAAASTVMGVGQGLPLVNLGIASYRSNMGIGMLEGSDIKKPKDLEGRKLGQVLNSVEVPFVPAWAKRAGVDLSKVEIFQLDAKVLEQALIRKNVDAISGSATSSVPKLVMDGHSIRFMLFRDYKLDLYGISLITHRNIYAKEPELCKLVAEGLFEGIKHCLLHPKESLDMFYKAVPEQALTASSRQFTDLGFGMWRDTMIEDEPKRGGLGFAPPERTKEMVDLIMEFVAKPDVKRPDPAAVFRTEFAGSVKLTDAEWKRAAELAAPYSKYTKSV